jgi:excisionase family DNA binding protein
MPLLTQDEVAVILRCSPQTVRRLRIDGKLPYLPGRPIKIRSEDLDRWVAKNTVRKVGGLGGAAHTPAPSKAAKKAAKAEANTRMLLLRHRMRRLSKVL